MEWDKFSQIEPNWIYLTTTELESWYRELHLLSVFFIWESRAKNHLQLFWTRSEFSNAYKARFQ